MARWKDLEAAIRGMHRGNYVIAVLEELNRMSIAGIRDMKSLIHCRNISQTTVNHLSEICRSHGLNNCTWMKEVKVCTPSPLRQEIANAQPLTESEIDWDGLVNLFTGEEIADSEVKVGLIRNLRLSRNVRSLVSAVMPPQIHRSMYKPLISRMNQRLYHKGSPYRLKFEPAPDLAAGHGFVQICTTSQAT